MMSIAEANIRGQSEAVCHQSHCIDLKSEITFYFIYQFKPTVKFNFVEHFSKPQGIHSTPYLLRCWTILLPTKLVTLFVYHLSSEYYVLREQHENTKLLAGGLRFMTFTYKYELNIIWSFWRMQFVVLLRYTEVFFSCLAYPH